MTSKVTVVVKNNRNRCSNSPRRRVRVHGDSDDELVDEKRDFGESRRNFNNFENGRHKNGGFSPPSTSISSDLASNLLHLTPKERELAKLHSGIDQKRFVISGSFSRSKQLYFLDYLIMSNVWKSSVKLIKW